MVRSKNSPVQASTPNMAPAKCFICELALNRQGEKRPGILCKGCKKEHCSKCAELPAEYCEMVKRMSMEVWTCSTCEAKKADLKSVLTSIENLASEVKTIKNGQDEQQVERERVIEGLKVVENVAKKIESMESVQAAHEERLTAQETATKGNDDKITEGLKRLEEVEEKLKKMDNGNLTMRLTNAVVKEVREIERKEKNFVLWNVPESKEEAAEDRKRYDEGKVKDVLKELKTEDVTIKNVVRVGRGGRYPGGMLVIMKTVKDCNRVMQAGDSVQLANDVRIVPDRTFNQREEARSFRSEKEKQEEQENLQPTASTSAQGGGERGRGRGRGKAPGRPRGRGRGGGRGGGGRGGGGRGGGGGGFRADSLKRNFSGRGEEEEEEEAEEEKNKRRKISELERSSQQSSQDASSSSSSTTPSHLPAAESSEATPTRQPLQAAAERPGTPHPAPKLAAKEGDASTNL